MLISKPARALLICVCLVLLLAAYPLTAAAVDAYRGDRGAYCEEGLGCVQSLYRGERDSYCEEGLACACPYRGLRESYCEEGLACAECPYRARATGYCEEGLGCVR